MRSLIALASVAVFVGWSMLFIGGGAYGAALLWFGLWSVVFALDFALWREDAPGLEPPVVVAEIVDDSPLERYRGG